MYATLLYVLTHAVLFYIFYSSKQIGLLDFDLSTATAAEVT